MVNYENIPRTIATIVSSKLATLHELDTVYGVEDLWRLLEVNTVDNYNQMVINRAQESF
ncbi:transglycosylase [Erwinia sp. V90_4]|uniref:transglycosylase n=1 Tax=Erwinia sp. V90_4 TaxID=3044239 RepID=UPI0006721F7E|nr:transglycosylase [Erwinia sp. V90_4]KMV67807.1 transglycosylase [bacteria symbiont BFo1 of Frankliniella occidentalis]MDI3439310.1 transglycosylase [Erwinia sp. V90_4]